MECKEYVDKNYVKTVIIHLRNQGKSFQEISDILREKYDIDRSRQAICGMYNRAMSNEKIVQNIDETLSIHDILNYHAIGVSCDRIAEILQADGVDISTYKIKNILKDNKDKLNRVTKQLEENVYNMIKNGKSKECITDSLRYKVELPTKSALAELIQKGTVRLLNEAKINTLGKILKQTQDTDLIRVVISLDNSITYKDIVKAAKQLDTV